MKTTRTSFLLILCIGAACIDASASVLDTLEDPKSMEIDAHVRGLYETFGADGAWPEIAKFLEENIDSKRHVYRIIMTVSDMANGESISSESDPGALEIMRKVLDTYPDYVGRFTMAGAAMEYVTWKGDASDIGRLPLVGDKASDNILVNILRTRVAGTNLFDNITIRDEFGNAVPLSAISSVGGWPPFIPSVANTGPQAVYVYEILKRYSEKTESDPYKIPAELLTMVVWFDADGNPVTNVDLAKYGLSMPTLDPKPDKHNPGDTQYTATFPHDAEGWTPPPFDPAASQPPTTPPPFGHPFASEGEGSPIGDSTPPPEQPQASPKSKALPVLGILALLAAVGCIAAWRFGRK